MSGYAQGTSVPVEKSRAEIEHVLERYGATSFQYGRDQFKAVVMFEAHERFVRFVLPLPARDAPEFKKHRGRGQGYIEVDEATAYKRWEQACRERWRSLALAIKAKLEAVRCGITEFEDEFLAHIVLPNRQTLGEFIRPKLREAYEHNEMPKLLGLPEPRSADLIEEDS